MTPHWSSSKGSRLEQDRIGDAHLADVVQQSSPADVGKLVVADAHPLCQLEHQADDPVGVPLSFAVAQLQGVRPAFQGRIIRQGQLLIRALQILE